VVTQQDISPPYDCCHVLLPRDAEDVFQLEGVGVSELPSHHATARTELGAARPNPFEAGTRISFEIAGTGRQRVQLAVYDVNGRRVRTLVAEELAPGSFEAAWDGRDAAGRRVGAGVYFARLVTRDADVSRKIVRLR
jgi:hypothetical protein